MCVCVCVCVCPVSLNASLQAPVRQCFIDSVALLRHANGDYWRAAITSQGNLSMDAYLSLWRPCWDWILHVHAQVHSDQ